MYFNSKNNTNIDDEFKNKGNLSQISKYIIFFIIILFIIGMIVLIIDKRDRYYLVLNGDDEVTIYVNSDYIEIGFDAYNSKNEDFSNDVEIESNLNTKKIGEYEIIYKFKGIVKNRKIKVVDRPNSYTYIYLNMVDNNIDIYLNLGDEYNEPGYMVFSSDSANLTDKVLVSGLVDTSKIGSYRITYSVVDLSGVTVSKSRMVYVMGAEINLTLDNNEWTNNDVEIKVNVIDEFFDYMILPDGSKVTKNIYSYKVSSNGKYKFKVYNSRGKEEEKTIEVNNIDKVDPSGSCSGSFKNGSSYIDVKTSDNSGIKRYEINGNTYNNGKITINKELSNVTVRIYDKALNYKDVSCKLDDLNKPVLFGKDIKLNYQYVDDGKYMTHALYKPSLDNKGKKIPLIVWLHEGGSTFKSTEKFFKSRGLLYILDNWKLEGFNAYVICPHMTGKWYAGTWVTDDGVNNLFNLIDMFVEKYNVDKNKIILVGHSQGARGVLLSAGKRSNYFSAITVMSGFDPVNDISLLKGIPAKGYSEGFEFMRNDFVDVFGKENYTEFKTDHNNIPNLAFNEDKNNDGRSDLIEWMLNQKLK